MKNKVNSFIKTSTGQQRRQQLNNFRKKQLNWKDYEKQGKNHNYYRLHAGLKNYV